MSVLKKVIKYLLVRGNISKLPSFEKSFFVPLGSGTFFTSSILIFFFYNTVLKNVLQKIRQFPFFTFSFKKHDHYAGPPQKTNLKTTSSPKEDQFQGNKQAFPFLLTLTNINIRLYTILMCIIG